MNGSQFQFGSSEEGCADALIAMALAEDLGKAGDITSAATIPSQASGSARFVARAPGVLAGLPVIKRLLEQFHLAPGWKPHCSDGDELQRGTAIAELSGSLRSILALERTALNFLQRLSGIATLTAQFVAAVQGTRAVIFDTRKTTPGWRLLEKYAVHCGGGRNHRMGLFDAVLIKDNHLAFLQSCGREGAIAAAVAAARSQAPGAAFIEVEVDSLDQFEHALACQPDIILLDNFGPEALAQAVQRRDEVAPEIELEASGGVSLENVAALARTGVDRISAGALTHSAPALDIGLDFEPGPS